MAPFELTLQPKKAFKGLCIIISFLVGANILGIIARYGFDVTSSYLIQLFNLNHEHNIPSLYSSLQLISCGILLFIIARTTKAVAGKDFWFWMGLGCLFIFLGIDEAIEIHERIALLVRETLNTTGVFYFAWIIPYGLLAIGMAAAYIPFLLRLPSFTKRLIIVSGTLYVAGALGMEAVGSYYHWETSQKGFYFAVLTTIEESVEMLSIALFLFTLLQYLDRVLGGFHLSVSSKQQLSKSAVSSSHRMPVDRTPVRVQNTYRNRNAAQKPDTPSH